MRRASPVVSVVVLASLILSVTGCAWRRGADEHYVGPVMFRHLDPPEGAARITDVVRFGMVVEGGEQWGIALGATRRLVAAPLDVCDPSAAVAPIRASAVLAARGQRWTFSPFYLRIEQAPSPVFVSRTAYGAELTVGGELIAFSVGATARTMLVPPADSLSRFVYDSSRPLATRFSACRDADRSLPLTLLERGPE